MSTGALATPAWIMAGRLRNVPGMLVAGGGGLTFVGESGPVFSVPLAAVSDVRWPWYWFGGGCVLRAAGERYKITFVRPNGAPDVPPTLLDQGVSLLALAAGETVGHPSAIRGLLDVRSGRRAGAAWREALPAA